MPNTHEVEAPANRLKFEAELAKVIKDFDEALEALLGQFTSIDDTVKNEEVQP